MAKQSAIEQDGVIAVSYTHLDVYKRQDPKTGKATRVGRKVSAEGTLVRYSKKSGPLHCFEHLNRAL